MPSHRIASFVLLAGGVFLVFAGLAASLGYSVPGMVASGAAIAALLYAGGVWFGAAPQVDSSAVLFTRDLVVAHGPLAGHAVAEMFPPTLRRDIEAHCRAALEGSTTAFDFDQGGPFEAAPVRDAQGVVIYGLLLSGPLTKRRPAVAG